MVVNCVVTNNKKLYRLYTFDIRSFYPNMSLIGIPMTLV